MHTFHGTIISCDPSDSVHSYLVEKGGRILFVGDTLPEAYGRASVTELGRRVLIPAFADTHMHFSSLALFQGGVNVSPFRSNSEILEYLSTLHEDSREEVVIGFGLSPHSVQEGRMVNRFELDSVLPASPVFIVKYDGLACVINSILLKMLPDKIRDMRGYHEDSGEMQQEAFLAITAYVTGSISPVRLVKNMLDAYDLLTSRGFGMIHTAEGGGFPRDLDVDLVRWLARGIRSGFQTRIFFQTRNREKVLRRGLPRLGGCYTSALDGCFGSMDAALYQPYAGSSNRGILYYSDEEVTEFCRSANRAGLQIEMHAMGDRAFDQAARALDAALLDCPREDHRHGIIHACLPTEEGMELCSRNGIQIPLQPSFLNWPQEPSSYLQKILGKREAALNPLRTLWDRGILLSGGSDAPYTEPDPIHGMYCACNHPNPSESLTPLEALKLYTINGFTASFDEKERGSLEEGKMADMVILSENPLTMPVEKLNTIRVEQTVLKGKDHPPHNRSSFLSVIRGMFRSVQV